MRKHIALAIALTVSFAAYQNVAAKEFYYMPSLPSTLEDPKIKTGLIAIGSPEHIWAVDTSHKVWKWNNETRAWIEMPKRLKKFELNRMEVGSDGEILGQGIGKRYKEIVPYVYYIRPNGTLKSKIGHKHPIPSWFNLNTNFKQKKSIFKTKRQVNILDKTLIERFKSMLKLTIPRPLTGLSREVRSRVIKMETKRISNLYRLFLKIEHFNIAFDGTLGVINQSNDIFIGDDVSAIQKHTAQKKRKGRVFGKATDSFILVTKVNGKAKAIAISDKNNIFTIGMDDLVYQHKGDVVSDKYKFKRISAAPDRELIGIEKNTGHILRLESASFNDAEREAILSPIKKRAQDELTKIQTIMKDIEKQLEITKKKLLGPRAIKLVPFLQRIFMEKQKIKNLQAKVENATNISPKVEKTALKIPTKIKELNKLKEQIIKARK